jgi:hypothetical protein
MPRGALSGWRGAAVLAVLGVLALLSRTATLRGRIFEDLRDEGPNRPRAGLLTRNYYQGLMDASRHPSARAGMPANFADTGLVRESNDCRWRELVPGADVQFRGIRIHVNRWGQRDRDYERQKPPGVVRVALVGASNDMGWGVEQADTYENRIEERLNRELGPRTGRRYEILNFSVPGYTLLEMTCVVEGQIPAFAPDVVVVSVTAQDLRQELLKRLAWFVQSRREGAYDFVRAAMAQSGARREDRLSRLERRIAPYRLAVAEGCFARLARFSERTHVPVAAAILRLDVKTGLDPFLPWAAQAAARHGLIVLPVFRAFEGGDPHEMYVDLFEDRHPTAHAHRAIADDLFEVMLSEPRVGQRLRDLPASASEVPR